MREFEFVINGKGQDERSTLLIEGFRCIVDCLDQEVIEEVEMASVAVPWSLTSSWESGALPVEGDEVEIPPGVWIELDIEETPHMAGITINGRLSFKNESDAPMNITIHSDWVYIRAGELLIGSKENPYNGNATIILYGDPESDTIAPSFTTEFGNKGLFILGLVEMYGQSRDRISRLRETAYRDDTTILVETGLDWQ